MNLIINRDNIDEYRNYNDDQCINVQSVKWRAGELDQTVLRLFSGVKTFDCSCNGLTNIEAIKLFPDLENLICYDNQLETLDGAQFCKHLRFISCNSNRLTNLLCLRNMNKLEKLYCDNNCLQTLEGLEDCINIMYINCDHNKLYTLEHLSRCFNLLEITCYDNLLVDLEGLNDCRSIEKIYASYNNIRTINAISNCMNIKHLVCDSNQIQDLTPLYKLRNLRYIVTASNMLSNQKIFMQRYMDILKKQKIFDTYYFDRDHMKYINNNSSTFDTIVRLFDNTESEFPIDSINNYGLSDYSIDIVRKYYYDQSIDPVFMVKYSEILSHLTNMNILKELDYVLSKNNPSSLTEIIVLTVNII